MKTITSIKRLLPILLFIFILNACEKDKDTEALSPTPQPNEPVLAVEGPIEGTWLTGSVEDLGNVSANFSSIEFSTDSSNNYTMTWHKKDGTSTIYAGFVSKYMTEYKHTTDASIWNISIVVQTINGVSVGGGWQGIYTFDNENRLLLNMEPSVVNWPVYPNASLGLGSGDSGDGSIYKFNRQ